MTAHAPWSAAATAFAGGDDEAETEVQEDPAVLRLRLARALPPVTGIMWRDCEEGEFERFLLLLREADVSSFSSSFFAGLTGAPAIQAAMPEIFLPFGFDGLVGSGGGSMTTMGGSCPVAR